MCGCQPYDMGSIPILDVMNVEIAGDVAIIKNVNYDVVVNESGGMFAVAIKPHGCAIPIVFIEKKDGKLNVKEM